MNEQKIEDNYSMELDCYVVSLEYSFQTRTGTLVMKEGSCTNMTGCIALFRRIDPDVRAIATQSGADIDTSYHRDNDGRWVAVTHTRKHLERGEAYDIPWTNKTALGPLDKAMNFRRGVSRDGSHRTFLNGKQTPRI